MANEAVKKKDTLIKDTMILCVITLIAGLLLGLVYDITAPIIADRRLETKINAYKNVFLDANAILDNDVVKEKVSISEVLLQELKFSGIKIDEAMEAVDGTGKVMGYVVTVTTSKGYKGDITITLGCSLDGRVTGMQYLTLNETVGLGSKAKDASFVNQFLDKQVEQFSLIKGKSTTEQEVEAISGATVTSKAVLDAMNAGVAFVQQSLIGQ